MELTKLYSIANQEFPHSVCIGLCAAHAIHLSMSIKLKDITETGRFWGRVEKKIRKTLWQESELDLIVKLCFVVYDVELSHSLHGLGGCTPKTFNEVLSTAWNGDNNGKL